MAGTITNEGVDVIASSLAGVSTEHAAAVAVGTGTDSVSRNDTALTSEIHREAPTTIVATDAGEREYTIEITGGTEIPAGTEVSEFGLMTSTTADSGTLIYREVATPITVGDGITQEFVLTIDVNIATE